MEARRLKWADLCSLTSITFIHKGGPFHFIPWSKKNFQIYSQWKQFYISLKLTTWGNKIQRNHWLLLLDYFYSDYLHCQPSFIFPCNCLLGNWSVSRHKYMHASRNMLKKTLVIYSASSSGSNRSGSLSDRQIRCRQTEEPKQQTILYVY